MKAFDAMISMGVVSCVNVLQFKTIPLLCKSADYLTGELPVQSFVILRKRNNLNFWLGFSRNQGVELEIQRTWIIHSSSAAYLLCDTSLFAFLAELYLLKRNDRP